MAKDRERLIEEAKGRVEALLKERLPAEPEGGMTLDEIEAVVESTLREVATWLEERLIQEQQPEPSNRAACPQCGASCRFKRLLDTTILTSHGPRTISRRYHYCAPCGQGFAPIDAVLGLEPGRDATRQVRA